VAESFGTDAELYDRTRPHYPDAIVERIVALSPGLDVGEPQARRPRRARPRRRRGEPRDAFRGRRGRPACRPPLATFGDRMVVAREHRSPYADVVDGVCFTLHDRERTLER
jgi:hypothetical protein